MYSRQIRVHHIFLHGQFRDFPFFIIGPLPPFFDQGKQIDKMLARSKNFVEQGL